MLRSASGRAMQAANPLTYMDPKDRQKALDKAKHLGGNLHDRMDVMMSKVRGDDGVIIDVAVIKATMQNPKSPKEKHVATLKMACSGASPRAQVAYTVHQLATRLDDKPGWIVALKSLMVFHRLMREVDPSFQVANLRALDPKPSGNNDCDTMSLRKIRPTPSPAGSPLSTMKIEQEALIELHSKLETYGVRLRIQEWHPPSGDRMMNVGFAIRIF